MSMELHVLIVEDSDADAELLSRALQQTGHTVTWEQVETAGELSEALERGGWDIVLADDALPEFDGLTALAMVQATGADLPFILVSGTIEEEVAVSALEAGANDYVLKTNLKSLLPIVEQEVRDAQLRRKLKHDRECATGNNS